MIFKKFFPSSLPRYFLLLHLTQGYAHLTTLTVLSLPWESGCSHKNLTGLRLVPLHLSAGGMTPIFLESRVHAPLLGPDRVPRSHTAHTLVWLQAHRGTRILGQSRIICPAVHWTPSLRHSADGYSGLGQHHLLSAGPFLPSISSIASHNL